MSTRDKKPKKYFIITFGCQMNEHDSEAIAGILESRNYIKASVKEEAELLIVNTCAVRHKAEQKVLGLIGRLKSLKSNNPKMLIAVCGCMIQQEEVAKYIRKRFSHIDLLFGTYAIPRLPELLGEARGRKKAVIDISETDNGEKEGLPVRREDKLKAWVTITYGCNNFCSYCIVPYVRGRERSRSPEEIINEVEELSRYGYKEVTLLGQNVNSYGKDLTSGMDFAGLICKLDRVDGLERIRYMTSHPRDFTGELIETIKSSRKICEHFHLPLQSGSNRILNEMNRGYTREEYIALIKKIRTQLPNSAITTDLIIGFPGETYEDFLDTVEIVRILRFDSAFTFVYSPRPGTPAADMSNQVTEETKRKRIMALIDIQNKITKEINKNLVGSIQEVLVEGKSENDPNLYTGRTRTNKIVNFRGDSVNKGETCYVKIESAQTWSIEGKRCK